MSDRHAERRAELADRVKKLYRRCSNFPENRRTPEGDFIVNGDAFMAMIELRNLASEIEGALLSANPSNKTPPK